MLHMKTLTNKCILGFISCLKTKNSPEVLLHKGMIRSCTPLVDTLSFCSEHDCITDL